ncbi:MBL fold metallo-hydrolase [Brevibacillus marinus]|uniref:MBL fold metallo-hydrolase n=1 Tax=Brevibacillus marinus TaxID=2496837 RepID=UPI000F83118C|nr:MBL fold metallo-hydrolase [Brevibacillus marinus]
MENVTCQVAPNVWAILTYEASWKSYINNYVVQKGQSYLLIDTNLRKHRSYMQSALQQIGATNDKIEQVYCTHRHPDHIGNVELFPSRGNWIHLEDYFELDDFSQTLFGHTFTGSGGELPPLYFRHLPSHTAGSVAFLDPESRVCFIGDHLCFFGDPLGEVVGFAAERRAGFLRFLQKWNRQQPEQVKAFAAGIRSLMQWPIEYLATGHGPILKGEIIPFFEQILQEAGELNGPSR